MTCEHCQSSEHPTARHNWEVLKADRQKLLAENARLRKVLADIREYECDECAHRHGSHCPACIATAALEGK